MARHQEIQRLVQAIRSVNRTLYTDAIIVLFVLTFGVWTMILYPTYRVNVRTVLQEYRLFKPEDVHGEGASAGAV